MNNSTPAQERILLRRIHHLRRGAAGQHTKSPQCDPSESFF